MLHLPDASSRCVRRCSLCFLLILQALCCNTTEAFPLTTRARPCKSPFTTSSKKGATRKDSSHATLSNFGFAPRSRCAVVPTPYFADNNDNNDSSNQRNQLDASSSVSKQTSEKIATNGTSVFQWLDEAAQQLKPAAAAASAQATAYASRRQVGRQYRSLFQSCLYYSLFLCYRAYRGFFVILPAVFTETFRKLRTAVDDRPFDPDEAVVPSAPMKLRTRITISILASVVILAYVVGGAIRVVTTLARSVMGGTSLSQSLQNAIQMYEQNERSLLQKSTSNSSFPTSSVNGSESMDQDTKYGLAP
jgi:hypothetical protein